MTRPRFGAGKRHLACKCFLCKTDVAIGEERWFDNSTFPAKPHCVSCYKQLASEEIDAGQPAAPNTDALIAFLRAELPGLIAKGIRLYNDPYGLELPEEPMEHFPDIDEDADKPRSNDFDDFV